MDFLKIHRERKRINISLLLGAILGTLLASAEYLAKLLLDHPQDYIPLAVRGFVLGPLIYGSIVVFGLLFEDRLRQKVFLRVLVIKSIFFIISTTFWLVLTNGIWFAVNGGLFFKDEILIYLTGKMYIINLISISVVLIPVIGIIEINSLHRKGELTNFITGKYHRPREVERIFCFIDLKGSTTIAEKLGHFGFANFLKDYYSDITIALRNSDAQIYQYIGDEVVLSWSFRRGLQNNNIINCYFKMKKCIDDKKQKYISKYGVYPEFKAGMHGGRVIVTWVGEVKKEIVYIGDVINTAARIQEDCRRLSKDFLISEELLNETSDLENIKATFIEEIIPRGKEKAVKLYSLEKI